jgi:hypothetical protein
MNRREFLKLCACYIAGVLAGCRATSSLDVSTEQMIAKTQSTEQACNPWVFPLSFPACFASNKDKHPHKQYFPLVMNG